MYLLINFAYRVSVSHLERGEILDFCVETFFEFLDCLFAVNNAIGYHLFQLVVVIFQICKYLLFQIFQSEQQLWISLFVFPEILNWLSVQEVKKSFVHVKSVCWKQKIWQEVLLFYGFHDALQILDSLDFPFDYNFVVFVIICRNLLIDDDVCWWDFLFFLENGMIFELLKSNSSLWIKDENFRKEVAPNNLLFFRLKNDNWLVFLHVLDKVETFRALDLNIVENVDTFEGEIPAEQIVKKYAQRPDISLFIILHAS